MLLETRFLVPIREDTEFGGDLHPYNKFQELEKDLTTIFGGHTVSPGFYKGNYIDPDSNKIVEDNSIQYIVALEIEKISELRDYLINKVIMKFRQKCLYYFNGHEVEILYPQEEIY